MPDTLASDHGDRSSDLRSPLIEPGKEPQPKSESEKICIDDMLQRHCGEFGPWQLKHFVLTSLAWALEAFHTMVMIFADREPAWRCTAVSGCDASASSVCGLDPGSWEWEWAGGSGSSTVAEWGLVCGDKYKVGLVQALFFGGCMIGQFLSLIQLKLNNFFFMGFSLLIYYWLILERFRFWTNKCDNDCVFCEML
jgi:OCT family organic cation transporter-like MFS transporter 4/5